MAGPKEIQMVIGLRMSILSHVDDIRTSVQTRLEAGESPFVIARNIAMPGTEGQTDPPVINIVEDKRKKFAEHLDALFGADTTLSFTDGKTAREWYLDKQEAMVPHNRDHTGNRRVIVQWWQDRSSVDEDGEIEGDIVDALKAALATDGPFNCEWHCTLRDRRKFAVEFRATPPTLVFLTDEQARTPQNLRGPISPDSEKDTPRTPTDDF